MAAVQPPEVDDELLRDVESVIVDALFADVVRDGWRTTTGLAPRPTPPDGSVRPGDGAQPSRPGGPGDDSSADRWARSPPAQRT
ncbi:hypothetical protein [Curtobacterium sp. Leaf183]|uniref:hypothetical protein n=1 Tax=Curtobacterium sp. Leaf183 TaxID=1736291 RepID=UPI0012E81D78|nr:hypothetical protein [Curtobacterium sp. Leaf183]